MVDRATGYHQDAAARNRESAHYFELLNSDFQNTLQKLGVFLDYCPAEGPTLEDNYMAKGEIIRSEALKRLLDLNVSQHLRRAMLRKTVKTRVPELLDGQPCAYWRWHKKGAKKREKMAWLRTGTTTVLVAVEQLRAAFGFESWNPSEEDEKAIKDAAASSIFE
ncbi:unnamed protein product, partial [Effrenium voratum]